MIDLQDKVVIITGASSGIGASLAQAFSAAGSKVAMVARRKDKLREVSCSCSCETLVIHADVIQENDRLTIINETLRKWGRIDILVNNAGLGIYGDILDISEREWRNLFEINVFAPVLLAKLVIPVMKKQGNGIIVNIASIGGLFAHAEKVTPYVASKHALVGFSRGLAKDLANTDIKVLAVCPHLTDTEFFAASPGADLMAPVVEKTKKYMESPDNVAKGIMEQLDSDRLIVFPTAQGAKLYEKQRDI
jgi:short-subunit dehydrogenase